MPLRIARPLKILRPNALCLASGFALMTLLGGCNTVAQRTSATDTANPVAKTAGTSPSNPPSSAATASSPIVDEPPRIELTEPILFQLLVSEIALQRQQLNFALTGYLGLARQTRDPRIAQKATVLAIAARSYDQAMESAKIWQQTAPNSKEARQMAEALQANLGKFDELRIQLVRRREQARASMQLAEFYDETARSLAGAQDRRAALKLGQTIAAPDLKHAHARFMLAQLLQLADQPNLAFEEVRAAQQLDSNWLTPVFFALQIWATAAEQQTQLTQLITKALQRHPENFDLRLAYGRYLSTLGQNEAAKVEFVRLNQSSPNNPQVLLGLGLLSYQLQQTSEAREYFQRFLEYRADENPSPALLYLGEIDEQAKNWREAYGWYQQVPPGPSYQTARLRMVFALEKLGQASQAIELARDLQSSSQDPVPYALAEAQLQRQQGLDTEALKVLASAVERAPNHVDVLYEYALMSEKLGDHKSSEQTLLRVIELAPNHAHAHNALGFSFADRGIQLDDARRLLEKAIALSPEDPYVIDSLGWLWFRKGDFEQAERLLRQAWTKQQDPEIAAHLGEVLWSRQQQKEAIDLWRQGLQLDAKNTTLLKTLERLKVEVK